MMETENWVAFGFLCFLALLAYLGVYRKVFDSLDARQGRIKSELDAARKLREEAQALLAEFERKGREAETEAAAIIESAKAEAERLAALALELGQQRLRLFPQLLCLIELGFDAGLSRVERTYDLGVQTGISEHT